MKMWPAESRRGMCAWRRVDEADPAACDQCRAWPAEEGSGEKLESITAAKTRSSKK